MIVSFHKNQNSKIGPSVISEHNGFFEKSGFYPFLLHGDFLQKMRSFLKILGFGDDASSLIPIIKS